MEQLVSASVGGSTPDRETSEWLRTIGNDLQGKLSKVGLASRRETATLAEFLDAYITGRTDLEPGTIYKLKLVRESLVAFLGATKPLHEINRGDADDWRQSLANHKKAIATISKMVKNARLFFHAAQRKKLVGENVFSDVKTGSQHNNERKRFIPLETVERVIQEAPDAEWRAIIALARYGGLRTRKCWR